MDARTYFNLMQAGTVPETSERAQPRTIEAQTENTYLLYVNPHRKGAAITNEAAATLYIQFSTPASEDSYAVKLEQGDSYEIPFGFTGLVSGIWTAANGNAQVIEFS